MGPKRDPCGTPYLTWKLNDNSYCSWRGQGRLPQSAPWKACAFAYHEQFHRRPPCFLFQSGRSGGQSQWRSLFYLHQHWRMEWFTMKKIFPHLFMSMLYVCLPAMYYSWRVTWVLVYVFSHYVSEVNEKFSALWNSMIWPRREVELPYIACLCCFHLLLVTLYKL